MRGSRFSGSSRPRRSGQPSAVSSTLWARRRLRSSRRPGLRQLVGSQVAGRIELHPGHAKAARLLQGAAKWQAERFQADSDLHGIHWWTRRAITVLLKTGIPRRRPARRASGVAAAAPAGEISPVASTPWPVGSADRHAVDSTTFTAEQVAAATKAPRLSLSSGTHTSAPRAYAKTRAPWYSGPKCSTQHCRPRTSSASRPAFPDVARLFGRPPGKSFPLTSMRRRAPQPCTMKSRLLTVTSCIRVLPRFVHGDVAEALLLQVRFKGRFVVVAAVHGRVSLDRSGRPSSLRTVAWPLRSRGDGGLLARGPGP